MAERKRSKPKKGAWFTPEQKRRMKTTAKWSAIGLITYEAYLAFVYRRQKRRDVFNMALVAQHETGKPLVVIGAPRGRVLAKIVGQDYDCGDTCIDEEGCDECSTQFPVEAAQVLSTMGDDSAVIYVSDYLERTENMEATVAQIRRVGGQNVFIVAAEPWSLVSWLSWGNKRRILDAPPRSAQLRWRDLPWRPGPSTTQSVQLSGNLRLVV